MKELRTLWRCDLCGAIKQRTGDDLPEGWRHAGRWVHDMHICANCRGQLERMKIIKQESWVTHVTPYQVDGASPAKAGA